MSTIPWEEKMQRFEYSFQTDITLDGYVVCRLAIPLKKFLQVLFIAGSLSRGLEGFVFTSVTRCETTRRRILRKVLFLFIDGMTKYIYARNDNESKFDKILSTFVENILDDSGGGGRTTLIQNKCFQAYDS